MLVRAPLVQAEQDSSIRIEDLTKVVMAGSCLGLAEERLVPFEATRHIAYGDDRPGAFHDISPVGLTTIITQTSNAITGDLIPRLNPSSHISSGLGVVDRETVGRIRR